MTEAWPPEGYPQEMSKDLWILLRRRWLAMWLRVNQNTRAWLGCISRLINEKSIR